MAEDSDSKTESATPQRRQEAMDQGNFPRSQDLNAAATLLAGILLLRFAGRSIIDQLAQLLRTLLGSTYITTPQEMIDNVLRLVVPAMFLALSPLMLGVFFAAGGIVYMQVGFRPSLRPLMPRFTRLNPIKGVSKFFNGGSIFTMAMNLVKVGILSGITWLRVQKHLPVILGLWRYEFPRNIAVAMDIIYDIGWRLATMLMLLAFGDWAYRRWKFERDLRMTKQEVKNEFKSQEGDTDAKGRRRAMARKMALQRVGSDVPRADVVVTNPTELAIALKYDPQSMTAPRVVAKGAGFLAMRIRQVAAQNGVPIVERKPLAQALYKHVEVGQEIPSHFYQAIAEILAYVFELSGKGYRTRKAS